MYRHFWRRGMKPAKFNHKMLPLIYQQRPSYWILSYFWVHVRPPVSMFRWLIYWHYRELNNVLFKLIKHRMHSIILKFYLKCTLNFQHNRIQNLNLEGHWWRLVSSFFMNFSTVSRKNYCEHWSIPILTIIGSASHMWKGFALTGNGTTDGQGAGSWEEKNTRVTVSRRRFHYFSIIFSLIEILYWNQSYIHGMTGTEI